MKNKLFNIDNVVTTFKGIAVSFVTGLILAIPFAFGMLLISKDLLMVGKLIQVLTALMYFPLWGYFAKNFWRWK